MSKKKVCKKCKLFVSGEKCPACGSDQFSNNWQGRVIVLDANKSEVAKKMGVKVKGEYTIKYR